MSTGIYLRIVFFAFFACKCAHSLQAPDLSASAPGVSLGDIGVEGGMPSVGVDVPSSSASLAVPGECLILSACGAMRWRPELLILRWFLAVLFLGEEGGRGGGGLGVGF